MSTIVLRSVKGTPLTNTEVDDNFSNLNTDKIQIGGTYSSGTASGVLFLNGSKVLTTGSALTFDGTSLGVNGVSVGRGAGAVSTNTAVGASALASGSLSGGTNTGIGYFALTANTTGANNTAVANGAMEANTTGVENSAVGSRALRFNTTGSYNSAFGRDALFSNTTASNNTAVGYQAGYSNQTGYNNAFFGQNTGASVTTGFANTFIGRAAGEDVTTGTRNTILGSYSGNQGGLDIRTASNYIVLSDGDGNPRQYYDGGTTNAWWMNAPVVIKNGAVPTPTTGATTSTSIGGSGNQITVGINGQSNGDYGTLLIQSRKGDSSDARTMAALNYGGIALRGASLQTAGIGITFPSTQSAASDANTLDDYEEGTWTPLLYSDVDNTNSTYYDQYGAYTKIGNIVYVRFGIRINVLGAGGVSGGSARIYGLPFVNLSVAYADSTGTLGGDCFTSTESGIAAVANGSTWLSIRSGNGVTVDILKSDFGNGKFVFGSFFYNVS